MKKNRRSETRYGAPLGIEDMIDIEIAIEYLICEERSYAIEYMRRGFRYVAMSHYKKWKEFKNIFRSIIHARRSFYGKWRRIH